MFVERNVVTGLEMETAGRIIAFVFLCLLFSLVAGIFYPIPSMARELTDFWDIFLTNFIIANIMMIPVFGWIFAFMEMWIAGSIIASRLGTGLQAVFTILSYAYAWAEILAYAFFIATSFYLVRYIKDRDEEDLGKTILLYLIGTALLAVGAYLEVLALAK